MSYAAQWNLSAPSKLSIFSVSDNKHLTLRTWDENNQNQQVIPTNPSDLADGPIVKGSSIAAIGLQDWTRVFGWTDGKDGQSTAENHLYMLSPAHQWINSVATISANTALAAIGTGPTSWIYYVDKSNNLYELNYNGIGSGQTSGTLVNNGANPHKKSRLGACLTQGNNDRVVAYQLPSGKIQVYNISSDTSSTLSNSFAQEGTPLAIISYKTQAGVNVSVYYLSPDSPPKLQRADSLDGGSFSTFSVKVQAGAPKGSTSLSAIWSNSLQAVVITYQNDSGQVSTQVDNK